MRFVPTVVCALMLHGMSAGAAEKKLMQNQLPPAVAAAVEQEAKGAQIRGFASEVEHGKKVYEAETIVGGHTRDLQFAADGTLNEVEEEIAFNSLAQPVRDALLRRTGKGRIVKVESLTKHGKLVGYEASTVTNGKNGETQVGPSGEMPRHGE